MLAASPEVDFAVATAAATTVASVLLHVQELVKLSYIIKNVNVYVGMLGMLAISTKSSLSGTMCKTTMVCAFCLWLRVWVVDEC